MWSDPELIYYKTIDDIEKYDQLLNLLNEYDWSAQTRDTHIRDTKGIWFPFEGDTYNALNFSHEYVNNSDIPIIKLCLPLLSEINNIFPSHKFIKGELYYLPAKTTQNAHVDPKVFHRFAHRVHIPLLSNNSSYLQVNENVYHLDPFNIYSFNNVVRHRSINDGDTPRLHLVVDVISNIMHDMLRKENIDIWETETEPSSSNMLSYYLKLINKKKLAY